jgi:hypothetical protein
MAHRFHLLSALITASGVALASQAHAELSADPAIDAAAFAHTSPMLDASSAVPTPKRAAQSSVYVELFGNGVFYSLNYDRYILDRVIARVGAGYVNLAQTEGDGRVTRTDVVTVPIVVSTVLGETDHKLELGAGVLSLYSTQDLSFGPHEARGEELELAGTAVLGYRYSPRNGGITLRAGYTPVLGRGGYAHWGGVSAGGVF